MWALLPAVMLGHVLVNSALRTYRMIWRYLGLLDALIFARNCAVIPAVLMALHISRAYAPGYSASSHRRCRRHLSFGRGRRPGSQDRPPPAL